MKKFHYPGGFSEGVIPVPISNTEVKPFSADDTLQGESRSSPGQWNFLFV